MKKNIIFTSIFFVMIFIYCLYPAKTTAQQEFISDAVVEVENSQKETLVNQNPEEKIPTNTKLPQTSSSSQHSIIFSLLGSLIVGSSIINFTNYKENIKLLS